MTNEFMERHRTTAMLIRRVDGTLHSIMGAERRGSSNVGFVATVAVVTLAGAAAGAICVGIDTGYTAAVAKWAVTNSGYWSGFYKGFDFGASWGYIPGAIIGFIGGLGAVLRSD
ncbi:MAG: hypothetical protein KGI04_00165 [Candidatus Micrarchaeota archaeon]|nr:hypothetical protein [Candidatus Micrarchaeota archaeon]